MTYLTARDRDVAKDARIALGLIAAIAVLPVLGISTYWSGIATVACYIAIMSSAWNLLGGFAGLFSLGPAGFALIGAYSVALSFTYSGLPLELCLVLAPIVGGLAGLALGKVTLRLSGPYFALSTLGFAEILRQLAVNQYHITRGDLGLKVPQLLTDRTAIFYAALALLAVTLTVIHLVRRSRFGLSLEAVREDQIAAAAKGLRVVRIKVVTFGIASALGGAGGALHASYLGLASPEVGLFQQTGLMIAAAVIGGMGTLSGPVIGAFLLVISAELLRDSPVNYMVPFAVLVIVFARFMPGGLMDLLRRLPQFRKPTQSTAKEGTT